MSMTERMDVQFSLYAKAEACRDAWQEREAVDWSQAEGLVLVLRQFLGFADDSELQVIVVYADANAEWDSGEVALWPEVITSALDSLDKVYDYRSADDGDNWTVFGLWPDGSEDWTADVVTETVAEMLVERLNGRTATLPPYTSAVCPADLLIINCPEWFEDEDFLTWLNNPAEQKMTWHQHGSKATEYSDTIVMVDPSLSGEGDQEGRMPDVFWNAIVQVCESKLGVKTGHHILVKLTNLQES